MDSSSEASIASAMAGANTTGSTETEDDGIVEDLGRAFDQHSGIETPAREVTSDELKAERPETTTERVEGDDLDKDIARSLDKVAPETRSAGHDRDKWRSLAPEARQQIMYENVRRMNRQLVEDIREEALQQGNYRVVDTMDGLLLLAQEDEGARAFNQTMQFAEEKDAQGQLKHPHFDELAKDICALLNASRADGRNLTLAQAYEAAGWANPATREKFELAQLKAKAVQNVPKPKKPQPDSIDRDLRANWDKAA